MYHLLFSLFIAASQYFTSPYNLELREQVGYPDLTKETVLVATYVPANIDIAVILRPRGPYLSSHFGPRIVTLGNASPHLDVLDSIIYQYRIWRRQQNLETPPRRWIDN